MKKNLSIKVISEACGIVPHTIRTWESRYQVFSPDRDEKGTRLYNEDDLLRAKLIARLIDKGHMISKLAALSAQELQDLLGFSNSSSLDEKSEQVILSINKLFDYLSGYKIDKVVLEIEHLRMSVGSKNFIFKVVLPVMQKIGVLVAKGKYSIAQEHIISTIIRDQLGRINLPNLGENNKRVILTTPDGNLHELSIIIADILCRANRVSTSYLGASLPADCLAEAINVLKLNTIILGVVSSDNWNYKKSMNDYLKKMDKHLKQEVKVILGGGDKIKLNQFKNIYSVEFMRSFDELDSVLTEQAL